MRQTKKLMDVHSTAMRRFDLIQSLVRDERKQCLEDRRFYSIAGAQWEGRLGEQFENKPKLEVNKIHLAVIRIISEYRNNRIDVNFVSKDGVADDTVADLCDGLYRADENDSRAEEAYDNAFEEGVGGGMGAVRLRCEYEDEEDDDNDHQRIRIEPIYDADTSVFFDPNSKRQDKSDAKYAFLLSSISSEAYEETYGETISSLDKSITDTEFDWSNGENNFIAEYFVIEEQPHTVHIFQTITGEEERYTEEELEDEELVDQLNAVGTKEVRQKRVKRRRVHKYILSGDAVLEDCGYIAGKHIPIAPYYGKRWVIDNVERCMGHVRLSKDSQRLKNMQLSKLAEISALSSVEKPILSPKQVAGFQTMWADDNIANYPYLLLNPLTDSMGNETVIGPSAYTRPPQIPPSLAALLQITEQDIQDILGNQQQADKVVSNISGDAIEMIQQRMDMQTFIYVSNFAKMMRRVGEIWLSMAKEVYVEAGRKMKTISLTGETDTAELMRPVMVDGEKEYENDLSTAAFDVSVEVGPSSNSRRDSTVRSLTNILQVTDDPETRQVLSSMIIMNMNGEGIQDVRDYFRAKMVKLGVVKPTEKEQKELEQAAANAQPDPNAEYLRAAAEQATAEATKARADTVLTVAKAEETKAKTVKTLSEVDVSEQKHILDMVNQMQNTQVPPTAQTASDAGQS